MSLEITKETSAKSREKSPLRPTNIENDNLIKDLVKKRGIYKSRLTKFATYISQLKGEVLSNQKRIDLKLRIQGTTTLFNEFNDIQTKLEELVSDIDEQLTQREIFENSYYSILSQAECLLNGNQATDSSDKCISQRNSIKLPTISMPTFNGSYEQWLEFRDTFLSLVHNSSELSNIEKFHYLKSSLKSSAELVIDSVEFSGDNYIVAWELLLNRYNNCRLLVQNHVKSLFTLQSLTRESPVLIRKLIDTVLKNLRALKMLGEPTESWDTLIIYIIVSKLDQTTEREWEEHKGTLLSNNSDANTKLNINDLLQFLQNRANMLETLQLSHSKQSNDFKKPNSHNHSKIHCNISSNNTQERSSRQFTKNLCLFCNNSHPLYSCQKFLDINLQDKLRFIENKRLCKNCLRFGHSVENCRFGPCRLCNKKHNSLIHDNSWSERCVQAHVPRTYEEPVVAAPATGVQPPPATSPAAGSLQVPSVHSNNAHVLNMQSSEVRSVLLSTALVEIADLNNRYHVVRALLDNGSQRCFITQSLCDLIQAPVIQSIHEIRGVGNSVTTSTQVCDINIQSRANTYYSTQIKCFVLPSITSTLPAMPKQYAQFIIPKHIQLADPQFYETQNIDILIGADKFWDLFNNNKIRLPNGPFLLDTKLGWVISGPVCSITHLNTQIQCNFSQSLDSQLRQFWELEEISTPTDIRTDEERNCEDHFVKNTTRNMNDGRFCVRVPFKKPPQLLGESYSQAERRFFALERRLLKNPEYKRLYSDFMQEYARLGHMRQVDSYASPQYFLPHHGVFSQHSTTTKLRVVFDASAATSNGTSLNELQMVGSPIQGDLLAILLRFRQHKFTACADIEKMYRQVLVCEDQRDLQLILWREDPSQPLRMYQLNTVTYGTASAPFLSCRCLKQLAAESTDDDVIRIIQEDFYVDDMITGSDNKQKLLDTCNNVSNLLKSGCFPLRKWMFNFQLDGTENLECDLSKELSSGNVNSKTLGLGWFNLSDEFNFNTQFKSDNNPITKRFIMSHISQIFDPVGLLSPLIMLAKILLQKLWLLKVGWDDPLPPDVTQAWQRFAGSLPLLTELRIPRHVIGRDPAHTEIHIFTDASESAYGSRIYMRTINQDSTITVRLYCSKGKVTPLKPVSIPRLELCGALLGAKLFNKLRESVTFPVDNIIFWCDSTIVLSWLRMAPSLLKTFVQNRVAEIHSITKELPWCHVNGKENPADLVSRGVKLEDLQASNLWWNGPPFLHDPDFNCQRLILEQAHTVPSTELPEIKMKAVLTFTSTIESTLFIFKRFSQFSRMLRSFAYVLRFIYNMRNKCSRRSGNLSVEELRSARVTLVKLSQRESFPNEYELIVSNRKLQCKSNLIKLNLFLDQDEIIRVGGRIEYSSEFTFDKKHPMLLSAKHWFTILLFRDTHKQLYHAGPQALLYHIRESYWPVGGRDLARHTVHSCVICTRFRGKTFMPIMGNLPQERITASFPFLHCGVDYAGPVLMLNRKGRGSKLIKAYICLFVCFATRAVHLELVSDLTSDAYLLALKRFISRRGKPNQIVSDNGKNFVGVANEFATFLSRCSNDIIEFATSQTIKFSFIPPYAPHFGGLWEAGVKSCKHHLLRVVGNAHLTFDELSTVLAQIEAILNSRPISPMSSNPNDFLPLSPAHFLVGRLLTAPATEQLTEVPEHRLNRYQRIEQIRQHFWTRWCKEYISEMQVRGKWNVQNPNMAPNTLVVIKDHTHPLNWKLGRVTRTIPGSDGVSRVADIQTASGTVRRAYAKICPLWQQEEKVT